MMNELTVETLRTLKRYAMTNAWIAQQADVSMNDVDFGARLGLLVEAETVARDNKRLQKLLANYAAMTAPSGMPLRPA
jgi:hypothetical protein